MCTQNLLSGAFCLASAVFAAIVISTAVPLTAQPEAGYTASGCGEFNGKVCKTVTNTSCVGDRCTVETTYYYYSTSID